MTRIAVLNTDVGPYHLARLGALAQALDEVIAVEVAPKSRVYEFWSGQGKASVPVETLFPDQVYEDIPAAEQTARVRACLDRLAPDAVAVAGYSEPVMRAAAQWAKSHQRPSILLLVTSAADRKRYWLKEQIKGRLVRSLFDAIFLGGERHRVYAESLGFPADRIWKMQNVADNEHFATGAQAAREQGSALRESLGLPERHFLFVGRVAPEKNLRTLLEAYRRYREQGGLWGLVLVGGGSEESELRDWVATNGVPEVHWAGIQSYDNLPTYYGLASALVLPSLSEPWGLVANEAAACGLPLLVSDRCGCVTELVQRGVNGFVFDPLAPEELARQMLVLSRDPKRARQMGEHSRRLVSAYTPEAWAAALSDCLATLLAAKC